MDAAVQSKIVDEARLLHLVAEVRRAGKTIVQCHGCFDIVHPGHVRYLQFARQQGDVLLVSITGDRDVSKGTQRPYIPQDLRAENLAALIPVDYVYVDPNPTAEHVLSAVRPDVYVKGREYERSGDQAFLAERRIVESYGGRIIFSSGEIVFSSSELIERMPRSAELESHRLNLLCRREGLTRGTLTDVLQRCRNLNVCVIGDVVLDRYVFCDAIGVASESPMMSLAQLDERLYVGGAAVVARHLAALGARPFLLTAGADDDGTRYVRSVLEREGVEAEILPARDHVVEKTRFCVDDAKLFKLDRARQMPLDNRAERRAAMIIEHRARITDAAIFCDFGYGVMTAGLLAQALPALRRHARIISADVSGPRANLLHFHQADLLCPTEREARSALNDYESGLSAVAWELMQRTETRHLIVTLEKRGLVAFERRSQDRSSPDWSARLRSEQLPAFADHAVDRLGCGDALLAASTLALATGAGLTEAAYLGSLAAAIEVGVVGNHPVTLEAMHAWIAMRKELTPPPPLPMRGPVREAVSPTAR
jgi:rfaE bifunctional protein kinase chain/domain/rfaE bifunctional protein nucleotidyltransferase chain/domain